MSASSQYSTGTMSQLPKDAPLPRGAPAVTFAAALCPGRTRHAASAGRGSDRAGKDRPRRLVSRCPAHPSPPTAAPKPPAETRGCRPPGPPGAGSRGAALTGRGAERGRRSGRGAGVAAEPRCHALPAAPFYTCRRRRLRGRPRAPASQSPRRGPVLHWAPIGPGGDVMARSLRVPFTKNAARRGARRGRGAAQGGAGGPLPPLHRSRVATSAAVGPHCRAGPLPPREFPPLPAPRQPPRVAGGGSAPAGCAAGQGQGGRQRRSLPEGSTPGPPQLLGRGGSAGGGTCRSSPGQGTKWHLRAAPWRQRAAPVLCLTGSPHCPPGPGQRSNSALRE